MMNNLSPLKGKTIHQQFSIHLKLGGAPKKYLHIYFKKQR
jgi:hypothetical protein